jgi:hypothetical protein
VGRAGHHIIIVSNRVGESMQAPGAGALLVVGLLLEWAEAQTCAHLMLWDHTTLYSACWPMFCASPRKQKTASFTHDREVACSV